MNGASLHEAGVIHTKSGKEYPPDTFPGTRIQDRGDGVLVVYPPGGPLQTKVTAMMGDFIKESWRIVHLTEEIN